MIAQLIILGLMFIDIGYEFAKHGEDRKGKYNGWTTFFAMIVKLALYYWAGLFHWF